MLRRDGEGSTEPKYMIPRCQEKRLEREVVPVPQTDTGRGGEGESLLYPLGGLWLGLGWRPTQEIHGRRAYDG